MELDPKRWKRRKSSRVAAGIVAAAAFGLGAWNGVHAVKEFPAEMVHMGAVSFGTKANEKIKAITEQIKKVAPWINLDLQIPTPEPSPVSENKLVHVAKAAIHKEAVSRYNTLEYSRKAVGAAEGVGVGLAGIIGVVALRPSRDEKEGRDTVLKLQQQYGLSQEQAEDNVIKRGVLITQIMQSDPNSIEARYQSYALQVQQAQAQAQQAQYQQAQYYPGYHQ